MNSTSAHQPNTTRFNYTVGVLYALAAGAAWGMVFAAPLWLPTHSPGMLSFGRYAAFGVIALAFAVFQRKALRGLTKPDWIEATKLSLVGNIIYYLALAAAIQWADAPIPTLIIGTLPLVIAVVSNSQTKGIAWRRLLPSLITISLGIGLVHYTEASIGNIAQRPLFAWGLVAAVIALICWTWYPIRNSQWLETHAHVSSTTWATAQGLTTLPLALLGLLGLFAIGKFDLGPNPWHFIGLMLLLGLVASWIGTWCWNRASQLLPATLAGQLIVFETLSALAYAFVFRGQAPSLTALLGIACLIAGVLLGIRAFSGTSSVTPLSNEPPSAKNQ